MSDTIKEEAQELISQILDKLADLSKLLDEPAPSVTTEPAPKNRYRKMTEVEKEKVRRVALSHSIGELCMVNFDTQEAAELAKRSLSNIVNKEMYLGYRSPAVTKVSDTQYQLTFKLASMKQYDV